MTIVVMPIAWYRGWAIIPWQCNCSSYTLNPRTIWWTTANTSQSQPLAANDISYPMLLCVTFLEPACIWAIDPSPLLLKMHLFICRSQCPVTDFRAFYKWPYIHNYCYYYWYCCTFVGDKDMHVLFDLFIPWCDNHTQTVVTAWQRLIGAPTSLVGFQQALGPTSHNCLNYRHRQTVLYRRRRANIQTLLVD